MFVCVLGTKKLKSADNAIQIKEPSQLRGTEKQETTMEIGKARQAALNVCITLFQCESDNIQKLLRRNQPLSGSGNSLNLPS